VFLRSTFGRHRAAVPAGIVAIAVVLLIAMFWHRIDDAAASGRPVLAVYGDSYSAGGRQGGKGAAGWPAIVAERLDADLRLHAAGGAGYVNGSQAADETFLDQVRGAPEPDADIVVVFGSRNDKFLPVDDVKRQAAAVYEVIRSASSSARLVVIGPAWDDDVPPDELFRTRDAVSSAAVAAGALFVDPLAQEWLLGRTELIGTDGVHPNDAGHAYVADLIEPVLRDALLGAPGA
jgi:lysophospholipase L1-like esterase